MCITRMVYVYLRDFNLLTFIQIESQYNYSTQAKKSKDNLEVVGFE